MCENAVATREQIETQVQQILGDEYEIWLISPNEMLRDEIPDLRLKTKTGRIEIQRNLLAVAHGAPMVD